MTAFGYHYELAVAPDILQIQLERGSILLSTVHFSANTTNERPRPHYLHLMVLRFLVVCLLGPHWLLNVVISDTASSLAMRASPHDSLLSRRTA